MRFGNGNANADRFHQMRGERFAQMANVDPGANGATVDAMRSQNAQEMLGKFLASRGAQATPENMQAAMDYMMGGDFTQQAVQSTTEDDIVNAAMGQPVPAMQSPGSDNGSAGNGSPDNSSAGPAGPIPNAGGVPDNLDAQNPGTNSAGTDNTNGRPPLVEVVEDDAPAEGEGGTNGAGGVAAVIAAVGGAAMYRELLNNARAGDAQAAETLRNAEMSAGLDGEVLDAPRVEGPRNAGGAVTPRAEDMPIDDVTVEVNPPRTDNALPAPDGQPQVTQDTAPQQLEQKAPNVGQAREVPLSELTGNVRLDHPIEEEAGVKVYQGVDGNYYITNETYDRTIRLTPDEFQATRTTPAWKQIIGNTLRRM